MQTKEQRKAAEGHPPSGAAHVPGSSAAAVGTGIPSKSKSKSKKKRSRKGTG
jgi:hypothetical protein